MNVSQESDVLSLASSSSSSPDGKGTVTRIWHQSGSPGRWTMHPKSRLREVHVDEKSQSEKQMMIVLKTVAPAAATGSRTGGLVPPNK